ncbi:amino acid adenylation domain-containing protein [Streptomyces sp. JH002]|uniref:amino acid adenylation domain-containing protein n=1 Tax=Streptomyces sp. JH002 TaxID=2763259 RepID=UPI003D801A56
MNVARRDAQYLGPELEFTEDDAPDLVRALQRAARRAPDAGVITVTPDGTSSTFQTYSELLLRARRLLSGLREHGVRPGDPVVLCGLPLDAFFPAFWACVLGGARPVAIADRAEAGAPALNRLRQVCDLLDAPLVLTDRSGAAGLSRTDPSLRAVAAEDCATGPEAPDLDADADAGIVVPDGADIAVLMLSSGSTGAPKAAQLTHHGLALFAASSRRILDLGPEDTTVNWLPVDHSGAFLLYHVLAVFTGTTNVHAPTDLVLADPLRWLDLLETHRATHSWAPAFGFSLVTEALAAPGGARARDLSRVRSLLSGGERIAEPVMRRFLTATGPFGLRAEHITAAWGMAETTTAITFGRLDRPGTVQRVLRGSLTGEVTPAPQDAPESEVLTFVACGAPAHRSEIRVVDDAGRVLPERWIGRLQVSSPRVIPGYANAPEADAIAFPDGSRWLETGDLAYLADGQLVMTGRRKDVIILNGLNVLSQEVEEAAASADGVRTGDVAACGVPGEGDQGESLAVFFVGGAGPAADATTAQKIRAALFGRLRLTADRVIPVPAADFPRTPAGKIRRAELLERLLAGAFDGPEIPTGAPDGGPTTSARPAHQVPDVRTVVADEVAAVLGRPVTGAQDTPFYELGLDSIRMVRLRARLEEVLGRPVPQTALFEHPTVTALGARLAEDSGPVPAPSAPEAARTEAPDRRIAVIGMAARFPGAADTDAYWRNLYEGVDSVHTFAGRDGDRIKVIGALDGIDDFDAESFGIAPREAGATHPAHRLFLEICRRALEHSGHAGDEGDQRIGVFAGSGMQLYGHQEGGPGSGAAAGDPVEAMQWAMGTQPDFLATRVAYRLGLTGPAIGVQTACSSSLVAVHLAAQSLLSGDADMALAGAAAVHPAQDTGYRSHPGSILSPSGRCRPFDAAADGTVGGNGVAAVVLKRLDRALADGDTVHAVILGSAVNNDGSGKVGFSAPGVAGQVAVVRDALRAAGITGDTVSYVEAHGTGTALGDPVEFEALSRALGEGTDRTGFCAVGSVKSSIGHLDTCAGMAGLIKTVLMLRHRTLLPTLHLRTPHPALPLTDGPLTLATARGAWQPRPGIPRRAGVSALGVGGTNAHVILEEAPPVPAREEAAARPVLLPLSARDTAALSELATELAAHLRQHPGLDPADVATTLTLGRTHHTGARAAVIGESAGELIAALESLEPGHSPAPAPGRLAFAFSGQGAPAGTLEALAADLAVTQDAPQPLLFAAQTALVERWASLGVRPDVVLAHSLGEYAALCAAGGLSAADALYLTTERGSLMRRLAPPGGAVALRADLATAERIARAGGVEVAAVNGPRSLVLSGAEPAIARTRELLDAEGIRWQALPVDRAFHSATLDAALDAFRERAETITFTPLRVPLISGLDGEIRPVGWVPDADHLIRHARRPVRFDLAMATAAREGYQDFLEIGPGATLAGLGRHCVPDSRWLSGLLPALAELYRRGHPLNWRALNAEGARVPLPGPPRRPRTFPAWRAEGPGDTPPVRTPAPADAATAHGGPASSAPASGAAACRAEAGRAPSSDNLSEERAPVPEVSVDGPGSPGPAGAARTDSARADGAVAPGGAGPTPHGAQAPAPTPPPAPSPGAEPSAEADVLAVVAELTARKLGVEAAEVRADSSFFALGADSLALMGMTAELSQRYGVRVPVRDLFSDADTPQRLAALITARGGTAPRPTAPAPSAPSGGTDAAPAVETPSAAISADGAGAPDRPGGEPLLPAAAPGGEAPAAPAPQVTGATAATEVVVEQLRTTRYLVDQVTGLMSRQLDLLSAGSTPGEPAAAPAPSAARDRDPVAALPPVPAAAPEPVAPPTAPASSVPAPRPAPVTTRAPAPTPTAAPAGAPDFSLYFFGDYPEEQQRDKYELIMAAGEFADQHGFHALWFPERHFDSFGALFPNPSVLAAALAARTRRVRLHAGSVVLPLHHPARVAEEWSVVDNISGGRAGICVASGWHARDFSLAPQNYGRHRELMYEQLETVRQLWSGDPVEVTAGDGTATEIRLHPRPLQEQPPLYVAVVGNPDSYRRAAREDLGIVTNLMAQTVEQLAENIALYRRTRAEHGLDPAAGRVVVLVHTFLGEDAAAARAEAYQPFLSYLRSSLALFNQVTNSLGVEVDLENTDPEDVDFLLGRAYERYCADRALIGDEKDAAATVRSLTDAGADEIACFVDFGVAPRRVLDALPLLDRLRTSFPTGRQALTPAQRRIWVQEQLQPGTRMYHEPKAIRLDGPLDPAAVRGALERVIARQPALRTVFPQSDGVPHREVREHVTVELPVDDHSGATEEEALRAVLDRTAGEVLDLARGPLLAARLLRLAPERHLLFLVVHHLVVDSASTAVLARDLTAELRSWPLPAGLPPLAPSAVPPPPGPERIAADLEFWRGELAGVPDLTLPTDHPRPAVRTGAGAALSHELDGALMADLGRYCAERRATVFMAMTAAIGAVLGRFSGTTDLVLGTAVDARPPDAAHEVGLFLDTVALRVDLSGDPDFGTVLHRVRDRSTAAYEHREVPFDDLVRALNPRRDPGRNPLFQVMVEYERQTASDLLDVPSDRAPFDLSFYLTHHGDGLRFMAEYDTALFTERTVRRLIGSVEQTLRHVLRTPDAPLSELTAPTDADRAELLAHHTPEPPAHPGADDTLHALFERQAERTPDAPALRTAADGTTVTYGELRERAHALAHLLRAQGARRGERVAVLLPRGPELITALLAVLGSGAAYLPLDPALPAARLAELARDGGPTLLLSGAGLPTEQYGALAAETGVPVLLMPRTLDPAGAQTGPPADPAGPDDPAYCLYTSGSTGRPKGVIVPHRGPAMLVRGHLAAHPALRTLQWTSPAFDVSVQEIFTTLAAGAELVLIDEAVRHDPAAVAAAVREHAIERMFMPCTPLRYLMETEPRLPSLRELFSAGEPLELTPAFRRFRAAHPRCELFNQYGPTEGSIVVTSHRVSEDRPPIGRPLPGVRIRLLDAAGAEVPVGAVGEIEIGGPAVAHGYHRRPDESAAVFSTGPDGVRTYRTGDLGRWQADGTLAFLGRTDDQVKIRGFRVEPAEARAALTRLPGVREAAVLARRDRRGEAELVAYVVTEPGTDTGTLRAALRDVLPGHLVPRHWVPLERLPVNASGKLDRDRLPDPAPATGTGEDPGEPVEEPGTPLEKSLHDLWCDELDLPGGICVTRSFFQLGGHSLSAIRLVHRMNEEHGRTGRTLTMAGFFGAPTVRAAAAHFETGAGAGDESGIATDSGPRSGAATGQEGERGVETVPATSLLRRLAQRHRANPNPAVYNVAHRLELTGDLDPAALTGALRALVARHAALRLRLNGERAEFPADVPFDVPVVDLTGAEADAFCQEAAGQPFDLERAPLFRFRLGRLAPDRWLLVVVLHHAVCDGWSMGLLWRDMSALYAGRTLPRPAADFPEYARWAAEQVAGERRAALERFWRAELDGVPLRPVLPYDRPRPPVLSGRGALHTFTLDGELPARIRETATELGGTPYTVLAGAFAVWLARLGGRSDVVLAASSANRVARREHEEVFGMLGEAVALRARLPEADTFAHLVARLGPALFTAMDHQALPLAEVVRLVAPEYGAGPFPAVLFTVVTTEPPAVELPGVRTTVRSLPVSGTARTELYVVLTPLPDRLTVTLEYSTDLFDAATIETWGGDLADLLARLLADPHAPLPGTGADDAR